MPKLHSSKQRTFNLNGIDSRYVVSPKLNTHILTF